jgi:hypothetical protein
MSATAQQRTAAAILGAGVRQPASRTRPMDAGEWRYWEGLIDERGIVIDRPRGHAHPLYPDMTYPVRLRPRPRHDRR